LEGARLIGVGRTGRVNLRCGVTISILAVSLLSACGGGTGSGDDAGGDGGVWDSALNSYIEANNDYVEYYHGEFQSPVPDEVTTDDERIAHFTKRQLTLLDKLHVVIEKQEQLSPALLIAVSEEAVPTEDVFDLTRFVDLTGRFMAVQLRIAERGLDCMVSNPHDIDRIAECTDKLVALGPRSDELAAQIDEITGRLGLS
jgi:hypothetical protein